MTEMTNEHDDFWRTPGQDTGTTLHVPGAQGGNQKN
jgi:hypothetical protein